jgi:hypothetical protein
MGEHNIHSSLKESEIYTVDRSSRLVIVVAFYPLKSPSSMGFSSFVGSTYDRIYPIAKKGSERVGRKEAERGRRTGPSFPSLPLCLSVVLLGNSIAVILLVVTVISRTLG